MSDYLPFVVIGLTSGSVYALAAMGLVVTYTTSGVFNFAHGAVGMMATYVFYSLRVDAGVPTAVAIAIAVLVVAPLFGIAVDRLLLRRLAGASPATYVVASIGLLVALQGLAISLYGAQSRQVAGFFPEGTYRLPGVNVGWDQTMVVLVVAAVGLALALFFRLSHLGLRMQAVVEAPALTELVGASAPRVTMLSWMLGSSFAALAGILLAPFTGLDAVLLTLLVIQAFGAAAIGRLTSLPGAYVGGLVIGVGAALATKLVAGRPALAGLPSSLPFIVLFAVLVLSRKGAFSEVTGESRAAGRAMPRLRGAGRPGARSFPLRAVLLATAGAVLLPFVLNNARLVTATTTLVFVLILASLGLLVGTARMVSLSHVAFVALGATVLARLLEAGVPYVAALVLAGLLVVPAGALVAIPAIRLSGLFLALATFGFAILAQTLLFPTEWGFGADSTVALPRPGGFQSETAFYYLVLAVVVAGIVAIEAVRVTRLGRMLRALADSPTAVESIGLKPTVSLVLLFCLCAFLAAVAGGLLGSITQLITPSGFDFTQSLIWLAVLVTAGASTFGGSVLAAVFLVAIPAVAESPVVTEYFPVVFGVAAILLAQARNGLVGLLAPPDFAALAQRDQWRLARSRHAARLRLARDAA